MMGIVGFVAVNFPTAGSDSGEFRVVDREPAAIDQDKMKRLEWLSCHCHAELTDGHRGLLGRVPLYVGRKWRRTSLHPTGFEPVTFGSVGDQE
jgi:hypothetical protein